MQHEQSTDPQDDAQEEPKEFTYDQVDMLDAGLLLLITVVNQMRPMVDTRHPEVGPMMLNAVLTLCGWLQENGILSTEADQRKVACMNAIRISLAAYEQDKRRGLIVLPPGTTLN